MTDPTAAADWRQAKPYRYALELEGDRRRWEVLRHTAAYRKAFDEDRNECARRFGIAGEAPHYEVRFDSLPAGFAFHSRPTYGPIAGGMSPLRAAGGNSHGIDLRSPMVAYRFDLSRPLAPQIDAAQKWLAEAQRNVRRTVESLPKKPLPKGRKPGAPRPKSLADPDADAWACEHSAFVAHVLRDA